MGNKRKASKEAFRALSCAGVIFSNLTIGDDVYKILMLIIAGALAGCVSKPTQEALASADYGAYPQEFQEIIARYMNDRLKDPSSAQYKYQNYPIMAYTRIGELSYGYAVCVSINAKNDFGGYTGFHPNFFLIKNGAVIYSSLGSGGEYGDVMAASLCKNYPVDKFKQ